MASMISFCLCSTSRTMRIMLADIIRNGNILKLRKPADFRIMDALIDRGLLLNEISDVSEFTVSIPPELEQHVKTWLKINTDLVI